MISVGSPKGLVLRASRSFRRTRSISDSSRMSKRCLRGKASRRRSMRMSSLRCTRRDLGDKSSVILVSCIIYLNYTACMSRIA
ncbi:hypothetical protein AB1N83_003481 [Pleurotus pulmonarius]